VWGGGRGGGVILVARCGTRPSTVTLVVRCGTRPSTVTLVVRCGTKPITVTAKKKQKSFFAGSFFQGCVKIFFCVGKKRRSDYWGQRLMSDCSQCVLQQLQSGRAIASPPRCCCAALCCVAVLFSTRSLPHVLLDTALSLSVAVRVLRKGARATWVCWCWLLLCCHGTPLVVLSPSTQHAVAGVQGLPSCRGRFFACGEAWVSWCRRCGASCSKLFYPSRCPACHVGAGGYVRA
jgi:hypothetical protein